MYLTFFFVSCGQAKKKSKEEVQNLNPMPTVAQIKISDLNSMLMQLHNRQLRYDFFGITSNGIDCIYFVPDSSLFAIEFEVMTEGQKLWYEKLKEFAQRNNYKIVYTTYDNRPTYKSSEPAPVLRIETKSDIGQTTLIGQRIMAEIFGNDANTIYDIVP